MPLPVSNSKTVWPPTTLGRILPKLQEWDALYRGDMEALQAVYGGGLSGGDPVSEQFYATDTGKFMAAANRVLRRWFLGEPARGNERNTKVYVPIAAEIAQASSDLLYSDPFTVTVGDEVTQSRIGEVLDEDFHTTIAEAAEMCAALGGVYLLVSWDPALLNMPFPTVRNADQAVPEFTFGRLTAVTFWTVVAADGKNVWRHLERHETGTNGNGVILHGLYQGTSNTLGVPVPLTVQTATAGLAANMDIDGIPGTIDTGTPGLAVDYVPNQTPSRMWRNDPIGRNLGRADIDGTEHLIDQLAETMSDLMRARRVARARVMFSKSLAQSGGPGLGSILNTGQEDYVQVATLSGKDNTSLAEQVDILQPTFDPSGYLTVAETLQEQILQLAGYSMQTFGLGDTGTVRTATEIESKERRSLMTRGRKIREWKPALLRFITKLLAVDNEFFGSKNALTDIDIEFSDGVQETQLSLAQTVLALYQAESASVEERLSILHPDWQEDQIDIEAASIRAEFAHAPLAPPATNPYADEDEQETADGGNPTAD